MSHQLQKVLIIIIINNKYIVLIHLSSIINVTVIYCQYNNYLKLTLVHYFCYFLFSNISFFIIVNILHCLLYYKFSFCILISLRQILRLKLDSLKMYEVTRKIIYQTSIFCIVITQKCFPTLSSKYFRFDYHR